MLQTLNIKNVALIKNLSIDFGEGFNVLLGETGAGKSIIFDSLNFVLGGKADKELLRTGEDYMKVDALFVDLTPQAVAFLDELGIVCEDNQVILSRQFSRDGKASIRINGAPIVASTLKKVGLMLVDSYSQHESMELLNSKNHLAMLDKFGGQSLWTLKNEVKDRYERYKNTIAEIKSLGGDAFERERTKALLEYQITEIQEADLREGEDQEVKDKLLKLANSEKICEAVKTCNETLENSSMSAIIQVQEAISALNGINGIEEIEDCKNRLSSCKYELQDINETLTDFADTLSFSSFELEKLDKRNDLIKSMLKKYGGSITEVLEYLNEAQEKFNRLNDAEFELSRLENLKLQQEKALSDACDSLTNKRKEVAKVIEGKVVKELAELGMKNTTFIVEFEKIPDFTANGNDSAKFTFSANKGQEVKALSKTASGGEMSRFMLAIKNIFSEFGLAETLIFDEIDSGIGGETGVVVGEKIAKLSKNNQVICITHLPQVACFGDNLFYVSKKVEGESTETHIEKLDEQGTIYQLARMTGGEPSEVALEHSKEMRLKAGK